MNQREIKFRVWDKAKKQWATDENQEATTELNYNTNYLVYWTGYELSQFTGLHDKNGKEIYEGDIVEWEKWGADGDSGIIAKGVIEYSFGQFQIERFDEEGRGGNWPIYVYDRCVIIGNIYVNGDLLK